MAGVFGQSQIDETTGETTPGMQPIALDPLGSGTDFSQTMSSGAGPMQLPQYSPETGQRPSVGYAIGSSNAAGALATPIPDPTTIDPSQYQGQTTQFDQAITGQSSSPLLNQDMGPTSIVDTSQPFPVTIQ